MKKLLLLLAMISATSLVANEFILSEEDQRMFAQELQQSRKMENLAKVTGNHPLIQTAQVMSVIAYTNTDFPVPRVDEKVIHIPEGWAYFSHSYHETTGLGNRKIYEPWVVRNPYDPSRIIEVHIKVEALDRWFGRSWVGAQLDVTIVPDPTR